MSAAVQQGGADGLCGLYALLNFLRSDAGYASENDQDILWYLLDAARRLGWLNPHTITQGFEDYQLNAILEQVIDNRSMAVRVLFLREVRASLKLKSVYELLVKIVAAHGAAVVSSQRRNHWLLVQGNDGDPAIFDSPNPRAPVIFLPDKSKAFSPEWGVVILPHKRPLIEVKL